MTICLVAIAATALAQPPAQGPATPVVVTTGEATVKRAPDRAWVTIAAESRARTAKEAQALNADAMSAVMQKLKAAKLAADAIRTASYQLHPEFDHRDGRQTLRGYVARNTIEVRIDQLDTVGQVLELAVGSGATSVGGVIRRRSAAVKRGWRATSAAMAGRSRCQAPGP